MMFVIQENWCPQAACFRRPSLCRNWQTAFNAGLRILMFKPDLQPQKEETKWTNTNWTNTIL